MSQQANGLQTWWHDLLQGASSEEPGATVETVAIATGRLASGWHGTGEGEMAGWAGHWHYKPPAIAHFVGGAPAGGKVDLMQGLNWWLYEAVSRRSLSRYKDSTHTPHAHATWTCKCPCACHCRCSCSRRRRVCVCVTGGGLAGRRRARRT